MIYRVLSRPKLNHAVAALGPGKKWLLMRECLTTTQARKCWPGKKKERKALGGLKKKAIASDASK